MTPVTLHIDGQADCAYLRLSDADVELTVRASDSVMVDLDRLGMVVGIELLTLDAMVPFDELVSRFHVGSEVADLLRTVVGSGLAAPVVTGGSQGKASSGSRRHLIPA